MDEKESPKKREFYNRPWFWIIVGVVILGVSGSWNSSSTSVPQAAKPTPQPAETTTSASTTDIPTQPTPKPTQRPASAPASNPPVTKTSNVTTPTASAAIWHTVATFSGSGGSNTDLFTIRGSKWQIQWTATADNNNGDTFCQNYASCNFDAFIYKPGGDYATDSIEVPVNTTKNGVSYFYTTGQFYIKVDPYKISNWTLTIQDYY